MHLGKTRKSKLIVFRNTHFSPRLIQSQTGVIVLSRKHFQGRKNSIGSIKTNTSMAGGVDGLSPGGTHV